MWNIKTLSLENWQAQSYGNFAEKFINVQIGKDKDNSIIFIATIDGAKEMQELVEQANSYLDSLKPQDS